jgi:hypothetical protein
VLERTPSQSIEVSISGPIGGRSNHAGMAMPMFSRTGLVGAVGHTTLVLDSPVATPHPPSARVASLPETPGSVGVLTRAPTAARPCLGRHQLTQRSPLSLSLCVSLDEWGGAKEHAAGVQRRNTSFGEQRQRAASGRERGLVPRVTHPAS